MSMPKYAARRDANEPDLITVAEQLGWRLWKMHKPADWLGLRRGVWFVVEIKNPDCQGHADEYTTQQKIFHRDVTNCGGKVLVWRTEADLLRDSGARN